MEPLERRRKALVVGGVTEVSFVSRCVTDHGSDMEQMAMMSASVRKEHLHVHDSH